MLIDYDPADAARMRDMVGSLGMMTGIGRPPGIHVVDVRDRQVPCCSSSKPGEGGDRILHLRAGELIRQIVRAFMAGTADAG